MQNSFGFRCRYFHFENTKLDIKMELQAEFLVIKGVYFVYVGLSFSSLKYFDDICA